MAEALHGSSHEGVGGVLGPKTPDALDDLDLCSGRAQLVREPFGWITDHEVVAPLRQCSSQCWPDIEAGVVDESNSACRVHGVLLTANYLFTDARGSCRLAGVGESADLLHGAMI
jgi:hypothetical protein